MSSVHTVCVLSLGKPRNWFVAVFVHYFYLHRMNAGDKSAYDARQFVPLENYLRILGDNSYPPFEIITSKTRVFIPFAYKKSTLWGKSLNTMGHESHITLILLRPLVTRELAFTTIRSALFMPPHRAVTTFDPIFFGWLFVSLLANWPNIFLLRIRCTFYFYC